MIFDKRLYDITRRFCNYKGRDKFFHKGIIRGKRVYIPIHNRVTLSYPIDVESFTNFYTINSLKFDDFYSIDTDLTDYEIEEWDSRLKTVGTFVSDGKIAFSGGINNLFKMMLTVVSTEESNRYQSSVCIENEFMIATDGNKIITRQIKTENLNNATIIIPAIALELMLLIIQKDIKVLEFSSFNNIEMRDSIIFHLENEIQLHVTKIDIIYPDWRRVVPNQYNTSVLIANISRKDILKTLDIRVTLSRSISKKERSFLIAMINGDFMTNNQNYMCETYRPIDESTIAFNAKNMRDMIKATDWKSVNFYKILTKATYIVCITDENKNFDEFNISAICPMIFNAKVDYTEMADCQEI